MATLLRGTARPSRRARRLCLAASAAAALVLATTVVWHSAYAAFTDSTPSYVTTWSTGTVAIADDDAGAVMFSATGIKPGATQTRCIAVTSTGTAPAAVRLYGTGRSSTKSLTSYLTLAVRAGSGGSTAGCVGFVPSATLYSGTLAAFPATYGDGLDSWTTAGDSSGETRTYQFTYSLSASAPGSAQGGTAAIAFTWEAQNT
jgi:hypothetical protein